MGREQKGKEATRTRNVTFVFHLQNCNYFSMYVFLPFWSLLQFSQVYSSLHRAGGRWDNSGSSVSHVLYDWVSPRLRQKRFPLPTGTRPQGDGDIHFQHSKTEEPLLRRVPNTLMVISYPCPIFAHKLTAQREREGADKQQGHNPHLPPLPSAIVPMT